MYNPEVRCTRSKTNVSACRLSDCVVILFLLISLGSLSACGQKTETTTTTVPVDTTVVDDDTLEVNDTARFKQTEHAR